MIQEIHPYLEIVEFRQRGVEEHGDGQEEEAEGAADGVDRAQVPVEQLQVEGELAAPYLGRIEDREAFIIKIGLALREAQ